MWQNRLLRERLPNLQSTRIMSLATLLDPRFKRLGFFGPTRANDADMMRTSSATASASTSTQDAVTERPGNYISFDLWSVWLLWLSLTQSVYASQETNLSKWCYLHNPQPQSGCKYYSWGPEVLGRTQPSQDRGSPSVLEEATDYLSKPVQTSCWVLITPQLYPVKGFSLKQEKLYPKGVIWHE